MFLNIKNVDIERVRRMVTAAISTDGAHHKQWYLIEIAKELDIPADTWDDVEKGIAP